jgi:CUB domain
MKQQSVKSSGAHTDGRSVIKPSSVPAPRDRGWCAGGNFCSTKAQREREREKQANLWARGVCCRCEATSASDFVEFSNYMAQDRKYSRYCGQLREFDVESDRHFFRVTFRSNDRLDGTGFHATYQFLEQEDTNTVRPVRTSTSPSGK